MAYVKMTLHKQPQWLCTGASWQTATMTVVLYTCGCHGYLEQWVCVLQEPASGGMARLVVGDCLLLCWLQHLCLLLQTCPHHITHTAQYMWARQPRKNLQEYLKNANNFNIILLFIYYYIFLQSVNCLYNLLFKRCLFTWINCIFIIQSHPVYCSLFYLFFYNVTFI